MLYDPLKFAYPSKRFPVFGRKGMVCTTQPLAAQAGLDILKAGGNAVDAAIAAAACMVVTEPTSNGLGGDAFALVWMKEDGLHGLNASGRAPMTLTAEQVRSLGHETMPVRGWIPVMVPGLPSAWAELSKTYGRLPLSQVVEPAAKYAEEGYPVTALTSYYWQRTYDLYSENREKPEFAPWFDTFSNGERAPLPGEIFKCPELARSIRLIGNTYGEAFYTGELADRIDAFSKETGGYIRKEDLESYRCQWVKPLSVKYHGYDVHEIPPNGSGIAALMTLQILDSYHFTNHDDLETIHTQLEAMKLGYADVKKYVADPASMELEAQELLSESYAAERRTLITDRAGEPLFGNPKGSGTIYLCTADEEGNMVSYIQSNFNGFGSGIVVPETGISLQNRGLSFSLKDADANVLAPGKKAYHTIIPGFLSKDGEAIGPFGVMGGFMQPQGHVQMVMNAVDFHMNPQECLDAPRWQWTGDKTVLLEPGFPQYLVDGLIRKGHKIQLAAENGSFGRGQIIWRNKEGILCGGTEPRADGTVAVW